MKKFIVLSSIYTAVVIITEEIGLRFMAMPDYARKGGIDVPYIPFMVMFSFIILAALVVTIIHKFIKTADWMHKKALGNIVFYIQMRAALIVVIMVGVWSTIALSFPELANTSRFMYSEPNSQEFFFSSMMMLFGVYVKWNIATYIPIVLIVGFELYKYQKPRRIKRKLMEL